MYINSNKNQNLSIPQLGKNIGTIFFMILLFYIKKDRPVLYIKSESKNKFIAMIRPFFHESLMYKLI